MNAVQLNRGSWILVQGSSIEASTGGCHDLNQSNLFPTERRKGEDGCIHGEADRNWAKILQVDSAITSVNISL